MRLGAVERLQMEQAMEQALVFGWRVLVVLRLRQLRQQLLQGTHDGAEVWALFGVVVPALGHEEIELLWTDFRDRERRAKRLGGNGIGGLVVFHAGVGRLGVGDLPQQHAEAEHVGAGRVVLQPDHLGSRVAEGAEIPSHVVSLVWNQPALAEIQNLRVTVCVKQNIPRVQIPMDDVMLVEVEHSLRYIKRDPDHVSCCRQLSVFVQVGLQAATLQKLHDDDWVVFPFV
mmetsp:Transcript_11976/g.20808  ORF Transcript_11976/g.20808 Transcript_11976/m.20808 type:complete len:229 (-) Transcript_11976:387-1073(-)